MSSRETIAAEAAAGGTSNTADGTTRDATVIVPTAFTALPVPAYEAEDNVTIENFEEPHTESIDDVLSRLVFHEDRPIENLPAMVSPELKLIGRSVSLRVKQTINGATAPYYYTGLVSMVTATTVTLMYVHRYTRVDFALYQSRERRLAGSISKAGYQAALQGTESDLCGQDGMQHGAAVSPRKYVPPERTSSSTDRAAEAAAGESDPAGSLAPALNFSLVPAGRPREENTDNGSPAVPRDTESIQPRSIRPPHFRNCAASLGVLPYVTFLRLNIHDVAFGRDPTSEFYALLATPSRQLMDMQFLRTFVRRYLVHTSEHNNPRQVPIYAFLTARGGCPSLDRDLVNQLVQEELPRLLQADRAIVKEKRKLRHREARLHAAIQEYRAPQGLFANTGVLFLTQIPQQTFLCAGAMLIFTLGFVVFLIISLSAMRDKLIKLFVARLLSCFIPSIMVWAMTGIVTLAHSTLMHVPLRQNFELLLARAILAFGSVMCAIASISSISNSMSNERIYRHLYQQRYGSLCAFYERHQCSGFYLSCSEAAYNNSLCSSCDINYPDTECFVPIWSRLQFATMPLLLLSVFILLSAANGLMVLIKLCLVSRSLSVAMRS